MVFVRSVSSLEAPCVRYRSRCLSGQRLPSCLFRSLLAAQGVETASPGRGPPRMQAYIVRRLLALIPTLFFASLIVFVTVRLIPGSVIDLMLSQNDISADKVSRDELIAALRSEERRVGKECRSPW